MRGKLFLSESRGLSVGMKLLNVLGLVSAFFIVSTSLHADNRAGGSVGNPDLWPNAVSSPSLDGAVEQKVSKMLADMTLEQKIGQMIQAEIRSVTPEEVKNYQLGSILNGGGAFPNNNKYADISDWLTLADDFHRASKDSESGIPILWGTDAVHGHNNVIGATIFPHNIGLGATRDEDLMYEIGEITAREVSATGIDWTFSPTLAVAKDIRWGRTYESFSSDTEWVSRYVDKMIQGLQLLSDDKQTVGGILATAKHYIADGGTFLGDDQGDTPISEKTLIDQHALPYFSALKAGVQTIMVSYSSVNGKKMHEHRYLIQDILKNRLGFDGFVISDWNGIGQVPGCDKSQCVQSINAGIDMLMIPDRANWQSAIPKIAQAVEDGTITIDRINDAVRRILRVKHRLGLFNKPLPSQRSSSSKPGMLGHIDHRKVAQKAVRKSLVLLKNNNRVLPLTPNLNVAVLGEGADNIPMQTGGWTISWQGQGNDNQDFPNGTSIWDGISRVVGKAGGKAVLASSTEAIPPETDVAIVVVGEQPYAEYFGDIQNFENLSLANVSPSALATIRAMRSQNIPVVTILLSGRPLWATPEINASDAFVAAWLPGSQGGSIADVLFRSASGEKNFDFTGRLPFAWPDASCLNEFEPRRNLFALGYGMSLNDEKNIPSFPITEKRTVNGCVENIQSVTAAKVFKLDPRLELESGTRVTAKDIAKNNLVRISQHPDGAAISWQSASKDKVAVGYSEQQNVLGHLLADHDLVIRLNSATKASNKIYAGMDCHAPCNAEFDITEVINQVATDQGDTIAMSLSCFAKRKFDFRKLNTPLMLRSEGKISVDIASVSFEKPPSKNVLRYICD